jgi:hypothetical protein
MHSVKLLIAIFHAPSCYWSAEALKAVGDKEWGNRTVKPTQNELASFEKYLTLSYCNSLSKLCSRNNQLFCR